MAGTRLPPIMDKDQENPNPKSNSQVPSEDSSTEANESLHEEPALEPAADSDKEDLINEDSDLEKKYSGKKGWLLFLILFITLGTGLYFYTQKKVGDFFTNYLRTQRNHF